MQSIRLKIIQTVSEITIPLLGYFFWHWNFYFIALFYLLDAIAGSGFVFAKIHKIKQVQTLSKTNYPKHIAAILLVYATITSLGLLIMPHLDAAFDVYSESMRFVLLRDMGLPQGIFLIPLVIYGAYLQYKMTFLLPQGFKTRSSREVYTNHYRGLLFALGCLGLAFGVVNWIHIPQIAAVISLVLVMAGYSFFVKK